MGSVVQVGAGTYALSYATQPERCLSGFAVSEDGYWTLENFQGSDKLGCVAGTSSSNNFYIATCAGTNSGSCEGAMVPDQEDKKCLSGWKRDTIEAALSSVQDAGSNVVAQAKD